LRIPGSELMASWSRPFLTAPRCGTGLRFLRAYLVWFLRTDPTSITTCMIDLEWLEEAARRGRKDRLGEDEGAVQG
jgi:hypothetical protein